MIEISMLNDGDAAAYDALHGDVPTSLLYTSDRYRRFLRAILPMARDQYLTAKSSGEIVGALPLFRIERDGLGAVLNSLPFFGSNGGLLLGPAADATVATDLLDAFAELARSASASTIIGNPLTDLHPVYERMLDVTHRSERIGQFSDLPVSDDVEDAIFAMAHPARRRAIRKGLRGGFSIGHDDSLAALHELARLHHDNITAIGGMHKPRDVFDAIRTTFRYDTDYRVYVARLDGHIVAALLLLFHGHTVEYFTPAILEQHRSLQPMSALIFHAMVEATRRGFRRWNWGGTWLTQSGVYDFKRKWGTRDLPYYYYTNVSDDGLLDISQPALVEAFPHFFVVPFSALRSCPAKT